LFKRGWIFFGFAISLLALYLALRGVQWGQVAAALERARYGELVLALLWLGVSLALAGLRWRTIINRAEISWVHATSALVMGLMTNNLLPGRLGEIVRALLLGRKTRLSTAHLMATVVIDRVFDLSVLVFLGLLVLIFAPPLPWVRPMAVGGSLVLLGALLMIGALISPAGSRGLSKLEQILIPHRFRPRLIGLRQEFQLGLKSIETFHRALLISFLSVLIWGAMGLSLLYTLLAFGLEPPLWGLGLLLVALNLGGLLPSSPGYVGTYHFLAVVSLGALGVPKAEALSLAFVSHAIWYVPQTSLGLLLLWHQHLALMPLARAGLSRRP
jgi:uncharacterized protein (TIRG00374 family)